MIEIRKFVESREREPYKRKSDQGFMFYRLKTAGEVTVDKINEVLSDIKKDFPNIKNEQIAVESASEGEITLFFYSTEIPIELEIEEFEYQED